ncbi:hypothetical protein CI105_03775 [Candidatus Izimaplasma bacterium ZiA1]|uniref:ABC transporter permease n=1 Tax=Candidatus Izimoplasma sp. ZiA1 TaxID=2024899 RepID=UPI000BAA3F57|nr:hypothetical protein CI105_03775 [Candidatus Izimaplasma bacterium ZiA1]
MSVIIQLVRRNMLMFLRDKMSVFFSFLSVIIIILLYALFLGDINTRGLAADYGNIEGVEFMVNTWIMAGILTVSTVTVPLGVLGNLIADRENGTLSDFYTSPISRSQLALSYLISSWIIGFMLVFANFIIGQAYIVINGGSLLPFSDAILVLLGIILSIIVFTSFFFFIALYMKTQKSFGLLSTLVGTFIGFLGGIYVPIGAITGFAGDIMKSLPSMHSVALIRSVYMRESMSEVFSETPAFVQNEYMDFFGVSVEAFGYQLNNLHLLLLLVGFAVLMYSLSIFRLRRFKL